MSSRRIPHPGRAGAAPVGSRAITLFQLSGAAVFFAVCILLTGNAIVRSPRTPFVVQGDDAAWIMYPAPVNTVAVRGNDVTTTFSVGFETGPDVRNATLEAQAFREMSLFLDGRELSVGERRPDDWKRPLVMPIELESGRGEHQLRVYVRNRKGPALLRLRISGTGFDVTTDRSWVVTRRDSPPAGAAIADDTLLNPDTPSSPTPLGSALTRWSILLPIFLVTGIAAVFLQARLPERLISRIPVLVLAAVTVFWAAFFAHSVVPMPWGPGFDADVHLEYVSFILENERLPFADEGWSMYHPPLFYLLTAWILTVGHVALPPAADQVWFLRILPCLAGLVNVWAVFFVARTVFRQKPLPVAFAVAAAGTLPMNIYMSAYCSNEMLHSTLVSLALIPAARLLFRESTTWFDATACGCLLGLAALTKFTGLLIVPAVLFFVTARLLLVDRSGTLRTGAVVGSLATCTALIAGWFYVRNWIRFGRPVVGNWEFDWWQQPGFHTPSYYLGFGESLVRPYFAGFHSFWDGLYSTLWGDGYIGGQRAFQYRHEFWNYEWMSVVYLLAIPATLVLVVGLVRTVAIALTDRDGRLRLTLTALVALVFGIGFSMFFITLRLPYYAQTKAFYGLCLVVPLSLVAAYGLAAIDERTRGRRAAPFRMLFYGWCGVFAVSVALSYLG